MRKSTFTRTTRRNSSHGCTHGSARLRWARQWLAWALLLWCPLLWAKPEDGGTFPREAGILVAAAASAVAHSTTSLDAASGADDANAELPSIVPSAATLDDSPAASDTVPDAAPRPHGPDAATAPAPSDIPGEPVRLNEHTVWSIKLPRGPMSPKQRAAAASQLLERVSDEPEEAEVRVESHGDFSIVYAGAIPVVQLSPDDAAAAFDASLAVHADTVAGKIRDAVRAERRRKATVNAVSSFSLIVFSGLIALLLFRKVGQLMRQAHQWIVEHPDRLPLLRVGKIDVVRPVALRGAVLIGLGVGRFLAQISIVYGWIIFVFSLFEATQGYTEKLTGLVLTPLSAMVGRAGSALPLLVIFALGLLVVYVLLRFTGLFFGSVARGETRLGWLPPDLAVVTGILVRSAILLIALLFVAPLVTGNNDGALSRAGLATLLSFALAATPLFACVAVGLPTLYGKRLRVGDYAEVGGRKGTIKSFSLLEVRLSDGDGSEVRVPHLITLFHPTHVEGKSTRQRVQVSVHAEAPQAPIRELILAAAHTLGAQAKVELLSLDASSARYEVSVNIPREHSPSDLGATVADALTLARIPLGGRVSDAG